MKTPVTVRIEACLLAEARRCARLENRTLTNFIETVLQRRVSEMAPDLARYGTQMRTMPENGPSDAG